jgi:hypothetical protein
MKQSRFGVAVALLLLAAGCGASEEADTVGEPLGAEGAHEHAVARLDLSVEGNRALIAFHAPAQAVYGFEREPRTDEELAARDQALLDLEQRIGEMVRFESGLQCSFRPIGVSHADELGIQQDHDHGDGHQHADSAGHAHGDGHQHGDDYQHGHGPDYVPQHDHHQDEGHRDVVADFEVTCAAPLSGTRVRIDVGLVFPAVERVDLRLVSEERQVGVRLPAIASTMRL